MASEYLDLRNTGSGQLIGFLAFVFGWLGLLTLVLMGIKAAGSDGRRRWAWLILMASLAFALLTPLPLLASVTTSPGSVRCGHPYLTRSDVDAARQQTATATGADECEAAFSSRRAPAGRREAASGRATCR